MNDKLFIPQSVLDKWVDSGKVTFNDNILTLLKEQKAYTLTSAVRFTALVAGDDTHQLIGKIRTLQKLAEMNGEHMSDSVILGDTAYTVQEGFVGVVLADTEVATAAEAVEPPPPAPLPPPVDIHDMPMMPVTAPVTPAAAAPIPAPLPPAPAPAASIAQAAGDNKDGAQDAEMLTKFLLNNLNF